MTPWLPCGGCACARDEALPHPPCPVATSAVLLTPGMQLPLSASRSRSTWRPRPRQTSGSRPVASSAACCFESPSRPRSLCSMKALRLTTKLHANAASPTQQRTTCDCLKEEVLRHQAVATCNECDGKWRLFTSTAVLYGTQAEAQTNLSRESRHSFQADSRCSCSCSY